VPTAYFLQMLRDDLYDVLVLYDSSKLYFDRGITGFSNSLFDTIRLVEAFAKSKGYDRVITYGASIGGFPALRAGLLLGADRAISIGGKYCWHVARLLRNDATVGAFDVLCPCFSDRPVEMVAVSAQNRADMRALEILRGTFPSSHVVPVDTQLHNVVEYLHSVRLLRLFCACLFEYWDSDIRAELLALLSSTARYGSKVQVSQAERVMELRHRLFDAQKTAQAERKRLARQLRRRHARELRAIHASTSWRLTAPLRRLADVVRRLSRMMRAKQ